MDENISHAIAMMGATLLFMVAFSLSVIFYDGLKDRADEFFEATSLAGKQESATGIIMNRDDLERKIHFEEVFLSILNLPAYVSGDGNADASKIILKSGDHVGGIYTALFNQETNIRKINLTDSKYTDRSYYFGNVHGLGPGESITDMLKDFCGIWDIGTVASDSSNQTLKAKKNELKNLTFSIQYSGDAIVYIRN